MEVEAFNLYTAKDINIYLEKTINESNKNVKIFLRNYIIFKKLLVKI